MKIQLSGDGGTFVFPSIPEEIKISTEAGVQRYSVLALGSVTRARGREPVVVSWDGTFFGKGRKKLKSLVNTWVKPSSCVSKLKKWEHDGEVLKLTISETSISLKVIIAKFSYRHVGGHGDVTYSISFSEQRDLTIKKQSSGSSSSSSSKKTTKDRDKQQKPSAQTYVINTNHSNLNFRTSPNGTVTTSMPKGTKVTSDGQTKDGWIHVNYNGKWGWAYGGYLKKG